MHRIHILGASGCGASTLAAALGRRLNCPCVDIDDFFWLATDPPYQAVRPREERQALLARALAASESWTLSGSLCGWGDHFIPRFTLVVFLHAPAELRLARLRAREAARFGDQIAPGGRMHRQHEEFLRWAAAYDTADAQVRSRRLHDQWLDTIPCPVLRLSAQTPTDVQIELILGALAQHALESPQEGRG